MFNHYNVKENMKMTTNGDLRTVETCTDTCSCTLLYSHKELRKTWLARSIPSSDSSWKSHKHKSELCHSTTCTVYKLNKFPHSCWPTNTCNNACITAAESDYTV